MTEPVEIPPHPFVKPVRPDQLDGRVCEYCGGAYDGRKELADGVIEGRRFVEITVQHEDPIVPPDAIITQDSSQPGRTVTLHRDPYAAGGVRTTTVLNPVMCSVCVTAAAQQAGLPPATVELQNQLRETLERVERAEAHRDAVVQELEEARRGYRALADVDTLRNLIAPREESEDPPSKTTRKKAAA